MKPKGNNRPLKGLIRPSIWRPSWHDLEAIFGHLGTSWDHLGLLWEIIGPSETLFQTFWDNFGASWGILGPSGEHFGSILAHLGLFGTDLDNLAQESFQNGPQDRPFYQGSNSYLSTKTKRKANSKICQLFRHLLKEFWGPYRAPKQPQVSQDGFSSRSGTPDLPRASQLSREGFPNNQKIYEKTL